MPEAITERHVEARTLFHTGTHRWMDMVAKFADDPLLAGLLDPHWVWVAEEDDQILGYVIAVPTVNNMVTLMRVRTSPDAAPHTVLVLVRQLFRDLRERNISGMYSHFDMNEPAEQQIASWMVKFLGGKIFVNVVAAVPKE